VKEVAQRARGVGAHLELRDGARAVRHGAARVEKDDGSDVRLLLVAFDVVAVHTPQDFPIQVAQVIAWRVLAMLDELDAEAVARAPVLAGQEAVNDPPRGQLEA